MKMPGSLYTGRAKQWVEPMENGRIQLDLGCQNQNPNLAGIWHFSKVRAGQALAGSFQGPRLAGPVLGPPGLGRQPGLPALLCSALNITAAYTLNP